MLLVNLLQRSGYAVFAADTTQAAYEIMQSEAAIDLLFSDLGASGDLASIELAEKAKALLPDLKIFYTSSLAEALAAYGPPVPSAMSSGIAIKPRNCCALSPASWSSPRDAGGGHQASEPSPTRSSSMRSLAAARISRSADWRSAAMASGRGSPTAVSSV